MVVFPVELKMSRLSDIEVRVVRKRSSLYMDHSPVSGSTTFPYKRTRQVALIHRIHRIEHACDQLVALERIVVEQLQHEGVVGIDRTTVAKRSAWDVAAGSPVPLPPLIPIRFARSSSAGASMFWPSLPQRKSYPKPAGSWIQPQPGCLHRTHRLAGMQHKRASGPEPLPSANVRPCSATSPRVHCRRPNNRAGKCACCMSTSRFPLAVISYRCASVA